MLIKQDLEAIGNIVDSKINSSFNAFEKTMDKKLNQKFSDFFENVLVPYFDGHVEKKLDEHEKRIVLLEKHFTQS